MRTISALATGRTFWQGLPRRFEGGIFLVHGRLSGRLSPLVELGVLAEGGGFCVAMADLTAMIEHLPPEVAQLAVKQLGA
ncbi:hypothetical protein P7B02_08155 [Caulobacter segnis]|uniref:hypothetical protein n=1 Tax=Caulobacter segnis TaxID=88688 RepID=UPI00240FCC35|nr:hypothetical protein [Caulobacter segnis]MDG2521512.1 hypothetical protein [Caulobacter segnis]